jgi:hypothetical protein
MSPEIYVPLSLSYFSNTVYISLLKFSGEDFLLSYDIKSNTIAKMNDLYFSRNNITVYYSTVDNDGYFYVATDSGLYRTELPVTTIEQTLTIPSSFSLSPAYPNPVSSGGTANIEYSLPAAVNVNLILCNTLGNEVLHITKLVNPGMHTERLSTAGLPPGVYYYTLSAGSNRETRMLIVR